MSGGITMSKIRNNEMKYYNMSSTTAENMLKLSNNSENKDELIKYHQTILSRIYPKGNIFSGNFNPIHNWKIGAQMTALNIQTVGPYLRINSTMFRQNGSAGYILKHCLNQVNLVMISSYFTFFFFIGL
jgi:hypothetical protein